MVGSALHGTSLGTNGQWSSALVWGANKPLGGGLGHSVLFESEAVLDTANTIFTRAEFVQKTADDLVLDARAASFPAQRVFNVGAGSVGYVREVIRAGSASLGIGMMGTVNLVPSDLRAAYGSRTPLGGLLFVRMRPVLRRVTAMPSMKGMKMDGDGGALP